MGTLLVPATARAVNLAAGQASDLVLGAPDMTTPAFHSGAVTSSGLSQPRGIAIDGSGSVYVADTRVHRIAKWDASPASNGLAFDWALMSRDASKTSWREGCSGSFGPRHTSVTGDGTTTQLLVADRSNNRVAIFTNEPAADGAAGTRYLGQAGSGSCGSNRGAGEGGAALNTLQQPDGVWTDGDQVVVADAGNNRVLLWNDFPGSSGVAASTVLGQADGSGEQPNRGGGPQANTINDPSGVWFDGTRLYVADTGNRRTLIWNSWPTTDGQPADYVLGQPDFVSATATCAAGGAKTPQAIATVGAGASHTIVVSDADNDRVDGWTNFFGAPSNGQTTSFVVGQGSMSGCASNRGGGAAPAANSLNGPYQVAFDGADQLWVADGLNSRVLRFPSTLTGDPSATRVLGQADFTTNTPLGSAGANVFARNENIGGARNESLHVALGSSGSLLLSDPIEHSVRNWTTAPAATNAAYGFRHGQAARTLTGANGAGSSRTASSLFTPRQVWTDGTRLLVADDDNNRVLAWTSMPTSDTDPADFVIGQSGMSSATSGTSSTRMQYPFGVASDGTDVYVSDQPHHRIMVFRDFWTTPTNLPTADVVLGQPDMTSLAANNGGISASTLNGPDELSISQDTLAVADRLNHRILVWREASTITATGEPADAVVGQANFAASGSGGLAGSVTGVTLAGNSLLFAAGCRAWVLDPVPATGAVTTGATEIGSGCTTLPSATAIQYPTSIAARAGTIWVALTGQARALRWTDATAPTITTAPTAVARCDGTVDITWATSESTTTEVHWGISSQLTYGAYDTHDVISSYSGLTHTKTLSIATAGTYNFRVRAADWAGTEVVSGNVSFTIPPNCQSPDTQRMDDTNAQAGSFRANPSLANAPPIQGTTPHASLRNAADAPMDRHQTQVWTTPPEDATALWHLDGGGAAAAEASVSTSLALSGGPGFTTGRYGQGLAFSASSQFASIADDPTIELGTNFTVEAWVRHPGALGAANAVLLKTQGDGCSVGSDCTYSLELKASEGVCASSVSTLAVKFQRCSSSVNVADGQWHHLAIQVTSALELRLYVDGLARGPLTPTVMNAPAIGNSGPLAIGGASNGNYGLDGELDEVRYTSRALTAEEILGAYRTKRPHAQLLWDSTSAALGSNCTPGTRCADATYAGPTDILRDGARYFVRSRFNTLNNDYWSLWSTPDWFETGTITSVSVTSATSVDLGSLSSATASATTSTLTASTTGAGGYTLSASDENTGWAADTISGTFAAIPDLGAATPAAWPGGGRGAALTVRSAGRLGIWGPAGSYPESDATNNWYADLGTTGRTLHTTGAMTSGSDTIVTTWRVLVDPLQASGTYQGEITYTAVANP